MVIQVPVRFVLIFSHYMILGISQAQLQVGFYGNACPDAESIITSVVRDASLSNSNTAAVLLRLHFHDCFVQGCDGSILIDQSGAERHAFESEGVGGFEVIERAKAQLEEVCPGVVSCADIVALAARDAIVLANGPGYQVPTGRRDGLVSSVSMADSLPDVHDSIQQLKTKFFFKGLSEKDLVVLTAAHTIGTAACFFMIHRLYNFFPGGGSDPAINPDFLPELKSQCPQNVDVNVRLPIDPGSDQTFDNNILQNIRNGFAVLASDARLYEDEGTRSVVDSYFGVSAQIFGPVFERDFVNSMVRMGQIGVLTGFEGEIRRVCAAFN
ncbi:peroxidase 43 isoform X3 [Rhododendron vialii]|uniref:peroxidase 43 isoform X3 n=1 Tax=Rhododendron vialii TaxID=182163 RepID=UPI00265FC7DC|nr:peroxidase 43 isoform X3 [Rhododendron vialii]